MSGGGDRDLCRTGSIDPFRNTCHVRLLPGLGRPSDARDRAWNVWILGAEDKESSGATVMRWRVICCGKLDAFAFWKSVGTIGRPLSPKTQCRSTLMSRGIYIRRWALLAVLCVAGVASVTLAAERVRATPREARAMFEQALEYMKANGPERSFAAFNNQKGKFIYKDLYVFVIDQKGVYHASGAAPEALVGLNVLNTTDAAGNPLFREMIEGTKKAPELTVRYMWLNRSTNKVEPKVSYIGRVGDYVLGVGYSAPRASAKDAESMLDEAVQYVREHGMEQAAALFDDRHGPFVRDDLYVFAVGIDSGKFEAMGMKPALVGTDAIGLKDAAGHAFIQEMIDKTGSADSATVDYVWLNPVTNAVEHKRSYCKRVGHSMLGVGHYLED